MPDSPTKPVTDLLLQLRIPVKWITHSGRCGSPIPVMWIRYSGDRDHSSER